MVYKVGLAAKLCQKCQPRSTQQNSDVHHYQRVQDLRQSMREELIWPGVPDDKNCHIAIKGAVPPGDRQSQPSLIASVDAKS